MAKRKRGQEQSKSTESDQTSTQRNQKSVKWPKEVKRSNRWPKVGKSGKAKMGNDQRCLPPTPPPGWGANPFHPGMVQAREGTEIMSSRCCAKQNKTKTEAGAPTPTGPYLVHKAGAILPPHRDAQLGPQLGARGRRGRLLRPSDVQHRGVPPPGRPRQGSGACSPGARCPFLSTSQRNRSSQRSHDSKQQGNRVHSSLTSKILGVGGRTFRESMWRAMLS